MLWCPGAVTLWFHAAASSSSRSAALWPAQIHTVLITQSKYTRWWWPADWCPYGAFVSGVIPSLLFTGCLETEIAFKTASSSWVVLRLAARSAELEIWKWSLPPRSWIWPGTHRIPSRSFQKGLCVTDFILKELQTHKSVVARDSVELPILNPAQRRTNL